MEDFFGRIVAAEVTPLQSIGGVFLFDNKPISAIFISDSSPQAIFSCLGERNRKVSGRGRGSFSLIL